MKQLRNAYFLNFIVTKLHIAFNLFERNINIFFVREKQIMCKFETRFALHVGSGRPDKGLICFRGAYPSAVEGFIHRRVPTPPVGG